MTMKSEKIIKHVVTEGKTCEQFENLQFWNTNLSFYFFKVQKCTYKKFHKIIDRKNVFRWNERFRGSENDKCNLHTYETNEV